MQDTGTLKREERAAFELRELYRRHGYLKYKMSKFEEYDLYVRNKDFLVSDRIITFSDTNGKLMALKPDVTLSIIRNTRDEDGVTNRICYDENVYRVSGGTNEYKEILQSGLECVGRLGMYELAEVVSLAAESLALIEEDFVLDLSHMGVISGLLDAAGARDGVRGEIARCLSGKNSHELESVCAGAGVSAQSAEKLSALCGVYGSPESVIASLAPICAGTAAAQALEELRELCSLLREKRWYDRLRVDFSLVNDMRYYDGVVFRGFLRGVPEGVLSGGRYDGLMRRMGRDSGAIGFAVYLDQLEYLEERDGGFDVDALLLYSERTPAASVMRAVAELSANGQSVSAQRAEPSSMRAKKTYELTERGVRTVVRDA